MWHPGGLSSPALQLHGNVVQGLLYALTVKVKNIHISRNSNSNSKENMYMHVYIDMYGEREREEENKNKELFKHSLMQTKARLSRASRYFGPQNP